jgi:hypothetical protein
MKNKQLFERLEDFDHYPDGFNPNLKTQRQLIEDAAKTHSKQKKWRFASVRIAGVFLLVFGGWMLWQKTSRPSYTIDQVKNNPLSQSLQSSHGFQHAISDSALNANERIARQYLRVSQVTSNMKLRSANLNHTMKLKSDSAKSHLSPSYDALEQTPLLAERVFKPQTDNFPQENQKNSELARGNEPRLFAKKQRIKQFEFAPVKTPVLPQEPSPKLEFFVYRDGRLKLFSLPQSQQTIINHSSN